MRPRTSPLISIIVFIFFIALDQLLSYIRSESGLDFMFLYYPISGAIIITYAISMLNQLFKGVSMKAIVDNMQTLVTLGVLTFTLFNPLIPFPNNYKTIGYSIIGITSFWVAHSIVKAYSKIAGIFTFSAIIVIFGYLLELIFNELFISLKLNLPFPITNIVFLSFLIPAILFLLSLLRYVSNDYLHYLGNRFSSNLVLFGIGVAVMFIQVYLQAARPPIPATLFPYFLIIEWIAVCGISYAICRSAQEYVTTMSQDLKLGEWAVLTQKITVMKGELNTLSEFLESGKKERLLIFISKILLSNNITYDSSEKAIRRLVQYRDIDPPKIMLVWRAKALEKENRRNRQKVLKETLDVVEDILNENYLVSTSE